jgi:hypothetical protein
MFPWIRVALNRPFAVNPLLSVIYVAELVFQDTQGHRSVMFTVLTDATILPNSFNEEW